MRKLHIRHSIMGLLLLVLTFAMLPVWNVEAEEEQKTTGKEIVVGYTPYDYMIRQDTLGNYYGYGVTYLNELAKRTGWTYKFVEVKETERIEKLINGEIDLLCNLHNDCQQKDQLLFCDEATGLEYGMLAALEDNTDIFFDDFEHINGKKIGINRNSDLENALIRYAEENGISYEPVYFESFIEMHQSLKEKEIDIMLMSSLRDVEGIKYVGKTYSVQEFFTTSKNNPELMDELNKADKKLKRDRPFYISALHDMYYGQPYEELNGITRKEYEFVSSSEPIKVACDANSYPIEYRDEKTGTYEGVYADALQLISQESGLEFEYIPLDDYSKAWEMIDSGEVDMIAGNYGNASMGKQHHLMYSQTYLTAEYTIIGRKNEVFTDKEVLALPKNYMGIRAYFGEKEPLWKIEVYDDVDACLKAVDNGEANFTAVNSIFLQTVYSISSYENLRIVPNMSRNIPIYIGVGGKGKNAQILKNVLDKAIYQIPQEEFQKCVTEHAVNIRYAPTLKELIRNYIPHIMVLVFAIVLAVTVIISKRERHFRHLALTDSVTGLWNGVRFYKETQEILDKNQDKAYLLLTLDINRFKFINNDFGSQVGDRILTVLGKRIHEIFGGVAYYARGTADVFMILIEKKDYREEMLNPLKKEIGFDNGGKHQYYKIIIKAGICVIPEGEKRKDVKRYADHASLARKSIKDSANENVAYYDEKMRESIERDIAIENKMEEALQNEGFQVYLQPKYYLPTGEIIGAEALVRWVEEDGTIVQPDTFIPLFERNGFILKVDFYVYEQVLKRMEQWIQEGRKHICVSVNVSRVHIRTYDFFIKLNQLMEKYHVPKDSLELELTESIIGGAQSTTRDFVMECKKEGYHVSIDDFGSGYSSLNLLKDLPVDILKIDKGFLDETQESERSSIIVQQVVEMAKKMQIGTLCEGVETLQQADFLKGIGCDMAQGYLFSKPVPMNEFEKMI